MNPILISAAITFIFGLAGLLSKKEIARSLCSFITIILSIILAMASNAISTDASIFILVIILSLFFWVTSGIALIYKRQRTSGSNDFQFKNELKN